MLARPLTSSLPRALDRRPTLARRPARPPLRRLSVLGLAVALLLAACTVLSTVAYLAVPAPTGSLAVGRATTVLIDASGAGAGAAPGEGGIPIVAWYPARAGSGTPASYVPGYDRLRAGLVASGELDEVTVAALAAVRSGARDGATVADSTSRFPVVLLSPGNATNVAFYAGLAEDLASRGYVVLGLDHPFQVAAVVLADGSVATYQETVPGLAAGAATLGAKIDRRAAEISAVLERIETDAVGLPALAGRLDADRVAVVGHSNGGLAAMEACRRLPALAACVNIDGQAAGGAFGVTQDAAAPEQPFLFLTKEVELHPVLAARFETAGRGAFRVVVPEATHGAFADGARFAPRLLPLDGTPDHVLAIERAVVGAFLDATIHDRTMAPFDGLDPALDLYIDAYPLGGRAPLPDR